MSDTHSVTIRFEQGYHARATFESVQGTPAIPLDEPAPLGEGAAPNAMDLLAAAIGNCLAASLLFCVRKSRAELEGLEVSVTTHSGRNAAGRLRVDHVDVELRARPAADAAAKLERCAGLFEDFCTVTASIRDGIPVNVSLKS